MVESTEGMHGDGKMNKIKWQASSRAQHFHKQLLSRNLDIQVGLHRVMSQVSLVRPLSGRLCGVSEFLDGPHLTSVGLILLDHLVCFSIFLYHSPSSPNCKCQLVEGPGDTVIATKCLKGRERLDLYPIALRIKPGPKGRDGQETGSGSIAEGNFQKLQSFEAWRGLRGTSVSLAGPRRDVHWTMEWYAGVSNTQWMV